MSDDNIVRLAAVNNSVATEGEAARVLVVQFLREWADAVETGKEDVDKVLLVLYDTPADAPNLFRIRTRRCNVDMLGQVGMMQVALVDLCNSSTLD